MNNLSRKVLLTQKRAYSLRLFLIQTKYRINNTIRSLKESESWVRDAKLPSKLRGTVVEKWVDYWRNLTLDYFEVYKDTVKSCREKPSRLALIASSSAFLSYLAITNPDETSFRDELIKRANDLLLVGPEVQNPLSVKHIQTLEDYYSQGVIKFLSLGLVSVVWKQDYNDKVAMYKANCQYLKPRYSSMYERILDVGFMGNWWILSRSMVDYDVNPDEWSSRKT